MCLKVSSAKWRLFRLGLNMLMKDDRILEGLTCYCTCNFLARCGDRYAAMLIWGFIIGMKIISQELYTWSVVALWCCVAVSFMLYHDDVIKWKPFPCYWPYVQGIHRLPVNSPHKGQWSRALMFSLIYAWINGWVNNCEAGDLRHHHAHYEVIVMWIPQGLLALGKFNGVSDATKIMDQIDNINLLTSGGMTKMKGTKTFGSFHFGHTTTKYLMEYNVLMVFASCLSCYLIEFLIWLLYIKFVFNVVVS